jgi:hypothetical protein
MLMCDSLAGARGDEKAQQPGRADRKYRFMKTWLLDLMGVTVA